MTRTGHAVLKSLETKQAEQQGRKGWQETSNGAVYHPKKTCKSTEGPTTRSKDLSMDFKALSLTPNLLFQPLP